MISIGELDRRITIQLALTSVPTDYGNTTQSFTNLITVWSKFFVKGGNIEDESNQLVGLENAFFIIRDPKFTSPIFNEYDYRIIFENKIYVIQNIKPVENRINDYLEIKTIEKNNKLP